MTTITQDAIFAYGSRRKLLLELGYESYEAYLASSLWQGIRTQVLAAGKCYGCGAKPNQVHHRSYSRKALTGRRIDSLVPVCARCHERIEFKNGIKVSPQEANEALEAIRANRPIPAARPERAQKPLTKKQKKRREIAEAKKAAAERRKQKKARRNAQYTTPPGVLAPPSFVANPNMERLADRTKTSNTARLRQKREAKAAHKKAQAAQREASLKAEDERWRNKLDAAKARLAASTRGTVVRMDCSKPGCSEPSYAGGLCRGHHRQKERQQFRAKLSRTHPR